MSIAVSIVSTIIKSAVKSEVENELSNELFGISIDGISEKGINKINDFINKGKSKIDNILSEDKMKSLAISEDNMAYVVAEIKGLFSEMEFTDEIFRQFKYDSLNLYDFLWGKYSENKTGYIECEGDIKKTLLAISETLIKLMCESEEFVKDISIQISNSVDDTRIEMREEFNKLDTYNQMILKILEQNQNAKTMKNMNTKLENKNISIFISYSSDDGMVVDELDKSLHPYLVQYIVELFNNIDVNKSNSQLIFNTHDTNLLDLNVLRRDQIWFVEKNNDNGVSDLFSLVDFSVRKSENIEKGYLLGRYGTVPFIKNDINL